MSLLVVASTAPIVLGSSAQAGGQVAAPAGAGPALDLEARAAVLIDAETGAVLYEKNAHDRLPPASLTKMATATVAIERGDLRQDIVASANSLVEPTVIGLEPGDRLPLGDALYGMMLNSGNDAALAIAESLGNGSISRFVGWMNVEASSLGLQDTHFANPHGLDLDEQYSSAFDMAVIGRVLMRQPALRSIVGDQRHVIDGPPIWAFHNINPFLTLYKGADGIKTGYETRAGRCLAASATRNGRRLIVVVLNSNRAIADASALMDYGFARPVPSSTASASLERRPPTGRVGRLLVAATGQTSWGGIERAYLRGALQPELSAFEHDPTLLAGPKSVFDRLSAPPVAVR